MMWCFCDFGSGFLAVFDRFCLERQKIPLFSETSSTLNFCNIKGISLFLQLESLNKKNYCYFSLKHQYSDIRILHQIYSKLNGEYTIDC